MKNLHLLGLSLSIAVLLAGCGGGGVSGNNPSNTVSKPALKQATSNAELEALIKKQMLAIYGTTRPEVYPVAYTTGSSNSAPDSAAGSTQSFSSTNTQETSVDEADRLKTNGNYLYTAALDKPIVRIFKANQATTQAVAELPLSNDTNTVLTGLYLDGSHLAALAEDQQQVGIWDGWFTPSYWRNQQSQVHLLNVADPAAPAQTSKLTLEGQMISSRRIGSTLYLATRHTPTLKGLIEYPTTDTEAAANRDLINQATLSDFLPDYRVNDGTGQELFAADDCFMTQYNGKDDYQTSIISLLTLDLTSSNPIPQGKCFAGDTETLYASSEAIYLATTHYNYTTAQVADATVSNTVTNYDTAITTDLHKFSLANGITYQGSGRVNGHLGWQQDLKPFRMSEHNGVLRLITYTGSWSNRTASPASLYTLQENTATQSLDILAKLPNDTRPAPLGKPGEQIYATRFLGDKGYLVTFQTTDPLYLLDLSNPRDPFIASELQIDGYSDYLHPVGNHYLLGIGKDAVAVAGGDEGRGAWYQGVKLSLIDISNPAAPYEKEKIIIGKRGTETGVSQSHHALTTLQQGNNLQLALPVSLHESAPSYAPSGPSTHYSWTQDELYRLNINTVTGTMQALPPIVGTVKNSADIYGYSYQWPYDRSVMIDTYVHYLHGDKVISQAW
ncbi:MAG: beta-propeller domain-containing protein [Candidatus Thiothrix putei]|uniref:Beta-propeller domain-containing protein n=1 Tax=Candidatus Thiothrix putei TaxID=3080811 RepID=A0AA95HDS1_9GAMM|nr:MAG: beta-propeller domain-containing protein [Candidatus Thiothrix putei]